MQIFEDSCVPAYYISNRQLAEELTLNWWCTLNIE